MPPVSGEIFSALAQKTHWWLHGLSQLCCHKDPSRDCSAATACAEGSKSHKTVLLLLLAREIKKMPSRIKCQSSKSFLILPLVPIPV